MKHISNQELETFPNITDDEITGLKKMKNRKSLVEDNVENVKT